MSRWPGAGGRGDEAVDRNRHLNTLEMDSPRLREVLKGTYGLRDVRLISHSQSSLSSENPGEN